MEVLQTKLNDCYLIKPKVFGDNRGFFLETFSESRYQSLLSIDSSFVQDNHSQSIRNVLRGLHLQQTKPQGKLVRVVSGEVFDVVVDLRRDSSSFGLWMGVYLSAENKQQLWVPPGFAHGFLVTSDFADLEYKCTTYYAPSDELCILWNDPSLNIEWPIATNPIVSHKDLCGISFKDFLNESTPNRR